MSRVDADLLGAHEALLGRTVEDVCRSVPNTERGDYRLGLPAVRPADSVVRITLMVCWEIAPGAPLSASGMRLWDSWHLTVRRWNGSSVRSSTIGKRFGPGKCSESLLPQYSPMRLSAC
jgi:hypothetical protein